MWCVLFGSCCGVRRKVRITVIAPETAVDDEEVLGEIMPSVDLATKVVTDPVTGHLPGYEIELKYRNSNCSPTYGALAAIDLHTQSGKKFKITDINWWWVE